MTNHFRLSAKTIADIYKDRWQIEIFFREIKQNLRIKSFVGTSENAVLIQIYTALTIYLLLAYQKFLSKIGLSVQQLFQIITVHLLGTRSLDELLNPRKRKTENHCQLNLLSLAAWPDNIDDKSIPAAFFYAQRQNYPFRVGVCLFFSPIIFQHGLLTAGANMCSLFLHLGGFSDLVVSSRFCVSAFTAFKQSKLASPAYCTRNNKHLHYCNLEICSHPLNASLAQERKTMKRFIILMSAIAILTLTSLGCGPTLTRYTVSEDGSVKVETIPSLSHPHYPTPGGDYDEMTGPPGMTREEMEGHVQAHLKQEAEKRREKEEKRRKEEENPFKGGGGGGGGH